MAAEPVDASPGRTPFGISLAAGAAVMVASVAAAPVLFPELPGRLLVVVLAVAGFAALADDARAGLAAGGLGYLLFDGFLVNSYGELTWTGTTSVWHLVAFAVALTLGLGWRRLRTVQARAAVDAELNALLDAIESNEKESRGA
ncbi:MAG TPA: hypothetical protein VHI50_15555 [Micromonosporaceae bacterium]|jgi:hypothetical protein|nr:hypothetical protein [Micromonosporaceae bacterium]